ncbi:putative signal transduction protein with CBS domains [Methanobacterium lacus]|uniref:Putative signal transduction protein with CBS domains n=2 Tax=Methanobacterium lacus (strain AL-21) TaxID=877455 RepID=F0T8D5_METLA|nr:putative signal transduction protein with CBS domains [Methanobacterium lacus]
MCLMVNLFVRSVKKIWMVINLMTVGEIMSSDPVTVNVDTQATKVRSIFREGWFRSIPVLSKNRLEGIISRGDIMYLSSTKSNIEARVIMKRPKLLATPEMDIRDVAKNLIKSDSVQAAVVESTENMRVVGILSMGDILKELIGSESSTDDSTITEIVTKKVVKANYDDHLSKVWALMDESGFSGLPVVKKDKLIGIITRKDIIKSGHAIKGLDNVDKSIKVEKVMVTPPIVVTNESSVKQAAELMLNNDIGRLPVVENPVYIKKEPQRAKESNIIGIIAREDILGTYLS